MRQRLTEYSNNLASQGRTQSLIHFSDRLVNAPAFEWGIIAVIIVNAILLGMETSPALNDAYGDWMHIGNWVALTIFIVEALLKMIALAPRIDRYFRDGWNIFDFSVIVFALIPATGEFAMIARLARLLRALRLISTIKELRLIVAALVRSIPSVFHVIMLMSIIVYIYAIIGHQLFHEHDPTNWGNLGVCVLTLFNMITLEGWTEIMATAMELHDWAWVYFVTYIVVATFVVINLFIAIIINNLDEAKLERLQELQEPASQEEILRELRLTQEALQRLEARLDIQEADISEDSSRQR